MQIVMAICGQVISRVSSNIVRRSKGNVMITFETQEDFEDAIVQAIMERLELQVRCYGDPFVARVTVNITNKSGDVLISDSYAVA